MRCPAGYLRLNQRIPLTERLSDELLRMISRIRLAAVPIVTTNSRSPATFVKACNIDGERKNYFPFLRNVDRATSRSRCSNASANWSSSLEDIPSSRPKERQVETVLSTFARIRFALLLSSLK